MLKKTILFVSFLFLLFSALFFNANAWIEEGDEAPRFTMYHYMDKEFVLDTLIGKKYIVLIAGSYT